MMFFKTYGLLWQNARNLKYIKWFNTKLAKDLADSKLKTKEFLKTKDIPVPETFFILKKHEEVTDELLEKLILLLFLNLIKVFDENELLL